MARWVQKLWQHRDRSATASYSMKNPPCGAAATTVLNRASLGLVQGLALITPVGCWCIRQCQLIAHDSCRQGWTCYSLKVDVLYKADSTRHWLWNLQDVICCLQSLPRHRCRAHPHCVAVNAKGTPCHTDSLFASCKAGCQPVTAPQLSVRVLCCVLQSLNVSYELKQQQHLVGLIHEVDCLPSYYITGGLVFAPLSWPLLEVRGGADGPLLLWHS